VRVAAKNKPKLVRRPRADAERNRLRLLETARPVFEEKGSAASLEEIAAAAGLGIGTLYRHFPTRDALIEAVYRNESKQLFLAAERLAAKHPPVMALREWLLVFVSYLNAKHGMAEVLNSLVGGASALYAESGAQMKQAITKLVQGAIATGEIRWDTDPLDLLRALAGVMGKNAGSESKRSASHLVDILIAGMRTRN
jgi:AcrR family transcriptional regulator